MLKTISGHYGTMYSLPHNNRAFIPKNVSPERITWNYNCVEAGGWTYSDIHNLQNVSEFWKRYRELNDMYWSNRSIAQTLEYERYQQNLRYMRNLSRSIYPIPHNPVEALITLLLLPLLIPCGIILNQRQKQIRDEWEAYKQEQWLRDMSFKATRLSLRSAIQSYDSKESTKYLKSLDEIVSEMGMVANNYIHNSANTVMPECKSYQFATLEQIYDKLFEPSFQEFQQKQRPRRRYHGTYLEQIREGQRKETKKKQQTKNARSRKTAEAIEMLFGIGDMDNTGYDHAFSDAKRSEELLKDFADHLLMLPNVCSVTTKELEDPSWQPPFANGLIILNLTAHADEATPGVHLTCIPYSRNCSRGPRVQAALGRAMAGMGYPSTWKDVLDENGERIPKRNKNGEIILNKDGSIRYQQEPDKQGIIDWIEDQKKWLQKEMKKRYDWDREYKGSHPRGNLSTPDYQVARSKERLEEIRRSVKNELDGYEQRILQTTDQLYDAVDTVLKTPSDYDFIVRYLSVCPEDEYETIIQKANAFFSDLARQEEIQITKTLNQIIKTAGQSQTQSSTDNKRDKSWLTH